MLSVIMPAYNAADYVDEAIQSILHQTYEDFEFLIVDDGSTDNTVEIARCYEAIAPRVKVISRPHEGLPAALNAAVSASSCSWIALMNADDVAMPRRLERQLAYSRKQPDVVAWGTYAYHINVKGRILSLSQIGPTTVEEFEELRRTGFLIGVIHATLLVKKEALLAAGGYDTRIIGCEDLELYDRLSEIGTILAIPEPLLLQRIHGSSISIRRFAEARFYGRYVRARRQAKANGLPPPSLREFEISYRQAPLLRKLRRAVDNRSQLFYRRFAIAVASGRYGVAAMFLGLSALLNPGFAFHKVWGQRISKEARRMLRGARVK